MLLRTCEEDFTSPSEAQQFVEETRVDTLAPAVGNMHGMLKSMVAGEDRKRLDLEFAKSRRRPTSF